MCAIAPRKRSLSAKPVDLTSVALLTWVTALGAYCEYNRHNALNPFAMCYKQI